MIFDNANAILPFVSHIMFKQMREEFGAIVNVKTWKSRNMREMFGIRDTVKLGNKERFDKEQIGIKELFVDYQPFYTINLLLDKELLPI